MRNFTKKEDNYIIKNIENTSLTVLSKKMKIGRTTLRLRCHELGLSEILKNKKLKNFKNENGAHPLKGRKWIDFRSPESIAKSQKTQFKKGHTINNPEPEGTEKIRYKSGTERIYIKHNGKFTLKHILVWNLENREVPNRYYVSFKDENPLNCEIDNLFLKMKEEHVLSKTKKIPAALVKTCAKLNRIKHIIKENE